MKSLLDFILILPDFFTSVRDKTVYLLISLAFRVVKSPFYFLTYFAPMLLLVFFLGAFVPIYGIYNAFISTLVSIRRTIDDFAQNY